MRKVIVAAFFLVTVLNAAEVLVVAHKRADSVGFYDAATGRQLAVIPVGVKPHELALSHDRKLAYVTNYGVDNWAGEERAGNSISIIDLEKRRTVGEITLGEFNRPHGIEMGRSGRLYVTCDFPPSLLVLDPKAKKIVRSYSVGSPRPHMVVMTPDEKKAYTANSGDGSVTAIDLGAGEVKKHISIGGVPMGFALTADGRTLYACTRTTDTVAIIDTRTDQVTGKIQAPGNPARLLLTPGDKYLLASLIVAGEVGVLDTATRKLIARVPAGEAVEGMTIDPAGRFGYASAQGDNKVVKFSLADWKTVLTISTDNRPGPMAVIESR